MIEIYRATSLLEAQMIVDLLQREGLVAEIIGELLPGGAGELPCNDLISVRVEAGDQLWAEYCLQEWDSQHAPGSRFTSGASGADLQTGHYKSPKQRAKLWVAAAGLFFGGFMAGAAVIGNYYRSPVTREGIDHNQDGVLDEQFTYQGDRLTQRVQDRNFDGQPDLLVFYDHRGLQLSQQWDDDFDGDFERQQQFGRNLPLVELIDSDGDGMADRRTEYRYGVPQN